MNLPQALEQALLSENHTLSVHLYIKYAHPIEQLHFVPYMFN